MELETIVKAIFIGLVLLLHLPDHPKSRFFYSKNESGVGSHQNPLSLPKSRLYTCPWPPTFNENNIGYSHLSRKILYTKKCKQIDLSLDFEDNPIYPFWDAHGQAR